MKRQNPVARYKSSTKNSPLLLLNRRFNAPVERLFKAFATPEAIKEWWWPKSLYSDQVKLDFKKGGRYFINMKSENIFDMGGGGMTGEFEEIIEDRLIVMTDYFADKNGKVLTAKEANMPGEWPETIYITFDFESHGESKSGFTLSQSGIPAELQSDCIQGWSESFDKLEKFLSQT